MTSTKSKNKSKGKAAGGTVPLSKQATKEETKKLEKLINQLDVKKKKFETEQRKHTKSVKELKAAQQQLNGDRKKLKESLKQLEVEKKQFAKYKGGGASHASQSKRVVGGSSGVSSSAHRALKDQYGLLKKKYDAESKRARESQKKVAQLEAENKVLKRKLANTSKKKTPVEDPRIRHLTKENKQLKKRLRKLMKELQRRRRWLSRNMKTFKTNQNKWLDRQRKASKDGYIVKYIFLDDIKKIKQYRKPGHNKLEFRNRIRVRAKDGGETVLRNVDIEILDDDQDPSKSKGKGKGKKKKGKSKAEEEEEMDAYMDEMMKELELDGGDDENEDDIKSDIESSEDDSDSDGDDETDGFATNSNLTVKDRARREKTASIDMGDSAALEAQIMYLTQEMESRAGDLETLKEVMTNNTEHPNPSSDVKDLLQTMSDRQMQLMDNLGQVHAGNVSTIEESNQQWTKWITNLASTIAGNSQQFSSLILIADQFLKELQGRIKDIRAVNCIYYDETEERKDEDVDEDDDEIDADFNGLKRVVLNRHTTISDELKNNESMLNKDELKETDVLDDVDDDDPGNFNENEQKINAIYNGLVSNNLFWNKLIVQSSEMHNDSVQQRMRLLACLIEKQNRMQSLIQRVPRLPSRKAQNVDEHQQQDDVELANGNESNGDEVDEDDNKNEQGSQDDQDNQVEDEDEDENAEEDDPEVDNDQESQDSD